MDLESLNERFGGLQLESEGLGRNPDDQQTAPPFDVNVLNAVSSSGVSSTYGLNPGLSSDLQSPNVNVGVRHEVPTARTVPSPVPSPFAPSNSGLKRLIDLETTFSVPTSTMPTRVPTVELPKFDGSDLESFYRDFLRWLRLCNLGAANDSLKIDWFLCCCGPKVKKICEKVAERELSFAGIISKMESLFPSIETDI